MKPIEKLKFDKNGLIPVIIQDHRTRQVLMLAYMNQEAFEKTLATGRTYLFSRSRKRLWLKGERSRHYQTVHQVLLDCDKDSLLIKVHQTGGACHAGYRSCFYRRLKEKGKSIEVVAKKIFDPKKIYQEGHR